jgi:hypothetical protein
MNTIIIPIPSARIGLTQMHAIATNLMKSRTQVKLYVDLSTSPSKENIANLKQFVTNVFDSFDNMVEILFSSSNGTLYDYSSTLAVEEKCPQQLVHEISNLLPIFMESRWLKNSDEEIWQFIVCPNWFESIESKSKYCHKLQCGDCKVCKLITLAMEN